MNILDRLDNNADWLEREASYWQEVSRRLHAVAELRQLGWTVFCDEEEDDVQ